MLSNKPYYKEDSSFCCAIFILDGRYDIRKKLTEMYDLGLSVIYYDCSKMSKKQFDNKFSYVKEECPLFVRHALYNDKLIDIPSLRILVYDKEGKAIYKMNHILPHYYISPDKKGAQDETANFFGDNMFDLMDHVKDFFLEDYTLSLSRATDEYKKQQIAPNYIDSIVKKCNEVINREKK